MYEDTFPADLAILASSNDGECFIKTSSLDGEKNLKKRIQADGLDLYYTNSTLNVDKYISVTGELQCEIPNKNLESFKGNINIEGKDYTLSEKQLLLKGASL